MFAMSFKPKTLDPDLYDETEIGIVQSVKFEHHRGTKLCIYIEYESGGGQSMVMDIGNWATTGLVLSDVFDFFGHVRCLSDVKGKTVRVYRKEGLIAAIKSFDNKDYLTSLSLHEYFEDDVKVFQQALKDRDAERIQKLREELDRQVEAEMAAQDSQESAEV